MAQDVQRLLLQIDASATLLRQEVAKARNDIDGFADKGAAKLKKIDAGFAGIGGSANAATARLAGFAAGLLSVGQAASFMVRANADMQRLSAMLEVATGSAGSAATAMSQLQSFAAETPFTLGQVTEAYIKLKNLGLDPSVDAMRSFGNTSAAMGKDLMQFIEAVADASTGQFERLLDFGIKASKSGEQVKFTFQGVTTTVQNNAAAITSFLRSLGDEGGVFAASMAKQMNTIDGKLSNLEDAAGRLATTVGSMGFNSAFIQTLDYLSNTMSGMAAVLQSRGFKGLFASQDDIMKAATPKGNAELLKGRRDAAARELDAARNARVLGNPQPQMVANAKAAFDARNREYVTFMRANADVADPMSRFALNERGRFGATPTAPAAPATDKELDKRRKAALEKQIKDIEELELDSFATGFLSENARRSSEGRKLKAFPLERETELGGALPLNDKIANLGFDFSPEVLQRNRELIGEIYSDLQGMELLEPLKLLEQQQVELAQDYTRTLTEGLAQAVIYGRNFGDVLKGLAQQIAASGLISILSGGKLGTSFGDSLGALTSIFGGKRETGGSVMPGKAYVVGEKRPEVFVPSTAGYIMPRLPTGQGAGGGQQSVNVTVNPSPLFIAAVTQGAQAAAQETLRKSTRQRMPQSAGV